MEKQFSFSKTSSCASKSYWEEQKYYYIRVKSISKLSSKLCLEEEKPINGKKRWSGVSIRKGNYVLTFELATRTSETIFEYCNGTVKSQQIKRLGKEAHIFSFQPDQVMTVTIRQQNNHKVCAYADIILTPFIAMPHTCHSVKVNMVERLESKEIRNQLMACLRIDMFFLLNFTSQLRVSPLEAQIKHNTAAFSQMRPFVRLTINGQKKKSLVADEGGIYPNWEKFAAKARENRTQLHSQGHDIFRSSQEELDQAHLNEFTFDLCSVAHEMKIQIISMPLVGDDAVVVGSATIRMESHGFFKQPMKLSSEKENKVIKLFWKDPQKGEEKEAAILILRIFFDFDAEKVRSEILEDDSEDDSDDDS